MRFERIYDFEEKYCYTCLIVIRIITMLGRSNCIVRYNISKDWDIILEIKITIQVEYHKFKVRGNKTIPSLIAILCEFRSNGFLCDFTTLVLDLEKAFDQMKRCNTSSWMK